jgi:prepilin-type N-terminal cleavage/methylation domain-containing protein
MINNLQIKICKPKQKNGFTLVETLVAIAILLIAVVEPLSIVSGSVATANLAKDQVSAYYLAQEGVELVRNVRDTNILQAAPRAWLYGLSNCMAGAGNYCQFDKNIDPDNPSTITLCQDNLGSPCKTFSKIPDVSTDNSTYEFGYGSGGTATTFKRKVTVTEVVANIEAEISVEIDWRTGSLYGTGSADRAFKIKERIFNWSGN